MPFLDTNEREAGRAAQSPAGSSPRGVTASCLLLFSASRRNILSGQIACKSGLVINVVTSAINTIMENNAGEMTFISKPIFRIINSIRPRVFISVPKPAASRAGIGGEILAYAW